MSMRSGVYIITNTKNGRVYIGSTVDFRKRRNQHKSELRRGAHHNPHLQATWDKYGKAAFKFGILEHLGDPEELHLAEQFWMDVYREEGVELYNFGLAACSPMLGRPVSEETRRKLSTAKKGNTNLLGHKHTSETRRKMSEAGKARGDHLSRKTRCRIGMANAKPYPAFVHQETGETIPAGVNLSAMCREQELRMPSMSRVKDGQRLSHRGWALLSLPTVQEQIK